MGASQNMTEELLREIGSLYHLLHRSLFFDWSKFMVKGMSGSQPLILEKLSLSGKQKVTDLAKVLNITSGAVTGLTDRLIANGYVTRKRSEEDRRIVYIEITPEGEKVLKEIQEHRQSIINQYFSALTEEELQHLLRLYRKVLDHAAQQNVSQERLAAE
jgi:DNA-binding MarR family transcriptional regulator